MSNINGEGNAFQEKWPHEEGRREGTGLNTPAENAQKLPEERQVGQVGSRTREGQRYSDDDQRFRHQEHGGKNPSDSKP
jgi:hypothetical protein